jgi:hypothetical protein
MTDQRFVRVTIHTDEGHGTKLGIVWGLLSEDQWGRHLFCVYTRSRRAADEFPGTTEPLALYEGEVASIVDADETNTPNIAFTLLAKRALLGETNNYRPKEREKKK